MLRTFRWIGIALALAGALLGGCSIQPRQLVQDQDGPRRFAIFFDGTANNEISDTNVRKLHALVTLQPRDDLYAIYIEGVGAGAKVAGMATGWGMRARLRKAYAFLLEHYRPGDQVYIFGFSRGAYAARILAAMLYYAGVPVWRDRTDPTPVDMAGLIFDAYKGDKSAAERLTDIHGMLRLHGGDRTDPVQVGVLGLWDTVEALGWPDFAENVDRPNPRYGDQLCNIERAYHAVSIDDNRARIFTPILLTRHHLLAPCAGPVGRLDSVAERRAQIDARVEEVWFSGAHADVGGGYADGLLSGVSLNWMLARLAEAGLVPAGTGVPQSVQGPSHDPEKGLLWGLLYHKRSRDIRGYAQSEGGPERRLRLHRSVIERLAGRKPADHEYDWLAPGAYPECFEATARGYRYLDHKNCFEIVD